LRKRIYFSPLLTEAHLPSQTNDKAAKSPRTIFLAEDDVDDQEFLKEAFLSIDPTIELVSFSSGLKFVNQLMETEDQHLPCLIILDYNIPEMNGADILGHLNQYPRFAALPKVVWSTSDSHLYRQTCLTCGASAYMVKPSSIGGIAETAKQMLRFCE
jgi:CheY-like chemotaxis protein